jgi:hypothetical protein
MHDMRQPMVDGSAKDHLLKLHVVMRFAALYIADPSDRYAYKSSSSTEGSKKAMHACMADYMHQSCIQQHGLHRYLLATCIGSSSAGGQNSGQQAYPVHDANISMASRHSVVVYGQLS